MNVGNGNDSTLESQLGLNQAVRNFQSDYMDMNVSSSDLMQNAFKIAQDGTPAQQMMVQQGMQERGRMITMLTQMMKMLHDLAMSIIRNLRLS